MNASRAIVALVEANPNDHPVGFGGLPNRFGAVELDVSLLDGHTLAAGSGARQGCDDALALARRVVEGRPHVLVAGEGAYQLASERGLPNRDLLSPASERVWRARLDANNGDAARRERGRELVGALSRDPERADDGRGAVHVTASDRDNHIACRVSTSDRAWTDPGPPGNGRSTSQGSVPAIASAPPPAPVAVRWPSGSARPTR